ncbi:MAG: trehalase-like domain-containing protein, partial [Thermaurantiacus sp.]
MSGTSWGTLDLAPIGNCTVSALLDANARLVWACVPRADGPAIFSALLGGADPAGEAARGLWAIDLHDQVAAEQHYERNTAVLRTTLTDADGASLEITDFCPRFRQHGRT